MRAILVVALVVSGCGSVSTGDGGRLSQPVQCCKVCGGGSKAYGDSCISTMKDCHLPRGCAC